MWNGAKVFVDRIEIIVAACTEVAPALVCSLLIVALSSLPVLALQGQGSPIVADVADAKSPRTLCSLTLPTRHGAAGIIATAIFGAVRYSWSGDVDFSDAALIGIPAIAGSILGTRLQKSIDAAPLQLGFAVLTAAVGIKLAIF